MLNCLKMYFLWSTLHSTLVDKLHSTLVDKLNNNKNELVAKKTFRKRQQYTIYIYINQNINKNYNSRSM